MEIENITLPNFEVRSGKRFREFYMDGVKFRPVYSSGVRPKKAFPELGIVVKFQHEDYDFRHSDSIFYSRIKEEDRIYFPKLYFENDLYSVHEYVAHKRYVNAVNYQLARKLRQKYQFNDFRMGQIGTRLDNKNLVYFDYSLLNNDWR